MSDARSLALSHFKESLTLDHFSLIKVYSPQIVITSLLLLLLLLFLLF